MPLSWMLLLACAEVDPMDPCASTGIWDASTGLAYGSVERALSSGVEDLCLGPGTYAMPCGTFEDSPVRITGAGAELTELQDAGCLGTEFMAEGPHLLQDLALSSAQLRIQPAYPGTVEVRDVVVRDLQPIANAQDRVILWGLVDVDGLEVRDSALPYSFLTIVGFGSTVKNLWVHDNHDRSATGLEFQGIELEDVRIEDNAQTDPSQGKQLIRLGESSVRNMRFSNNVGELELDGQVFLSDLAVEAATTSEGHSINILSGSVVSMTAAQLTRSGGVSMDSGSTLLLKDAEFADQECPIRCGGVCLAPAERVSCP
ncbi:MAG: hypothetical protein ACI9VR_004803 [Cognaticolwellia sp.]|jgi:hypothetical protein